ncbi:MAG: alanine:cation symporter family protein [Pseudobacteriovorax sp.]|nr:alanine:cation symporter family protein [Pseudobacteriovorax sp.]
MQAAVDWLNSWIWSWGLIGFCLAMGVYFSITTRFLQVRHLFHMIGLLLDSSSSKKGVSSFQALALSISGRVGTGNIAGVASAIAFGGPGAVFWMWIIAFLGAGTAFAESALAQMYKVEQDGEFRGGPAYFIERALGWKTYAAVFAVATIIAAGFLLPGVQANSIAAGFTQAFDIPPVYTATFLVAILGLIIFGGVKRITLVAEFAVPFMAVAYILVALSIIWINFDKIPEVWTLIMSSAFAIDSTFGGMLGMAISWGVKRGIYSNEAGQGTGPHAAAAAAVSHPAKQGLVQAFSVYIDTLFVCSATAFMILSTGMYNVIGPEGAAVVNNLGAVEVGPIFTQKAVDSAYAGFGSPFVATSLLFFAFTTLMAYYYIAETNVAYLTRKVDSKIMINVLRVMLLVSVFYGSVKTASVAWALGDLGVGLMAWLNLVALVFLRRPAIKVLEDYEEQKRAGVEPVFDTKKFVIPEDSVWDTPANQERIAANRRALQQT